MSIRIRMEDNSGDVISQMEKNVLAALTAMGEESVGMIVRMMNTGYGRPIWRTGNLMREEHYKVRASDHAVDVGTPMEYAPFVHDGTSKMPARPYITDTLTSSDNLEALKEIAQDALSQGFE